MHVSVSRRNVMRHSELSSLLDIALSRPLEILRYAGERLDISRRPFVNRLEYDRAAFAVNQDGIAVEAKLFGQADRLASARSEHAGDLPPRRGLGHDSYR